MKAHFYFIHSIFSYLTSFYTSSRNSPPPTSLTPGPTNTMLKLNGAPGDGDPAASMLSSVRIHEIILNFYLNIETVMHFFRN